MLKQHNPFGGEPPSNTPKFKSRPSEPAAEEMSHFDRMADHDNVLGNSHGQDEDESFIASLQDLLGCVC